MIDWIHSLAEAFIDFVVTDRLIAAGGLFRAFLVLCGIATVVVAVWWIGWLMRWW
ncbi:MAG: hypothetical protein KF691_10740 [Phycisphaeraceae bacterium]|nr:hypothetical protein [Phycisphaeraceae bacterium]